MRLSARTIHSAVGLALLLPAGLLGACGFPPSPAPAAAVATYAWHLPAGFPVPKVPADNPMTPAKVELGRYLFYDKRLSANQTLSCASCHQQIRAFSDGRTVPVGVTGAAHPRNSMALFNLAYNTSLTWANSQLTRLETQMLVPIFGETPPEMGMSGHEQELLARLRNDARYRQQFAEAFPADDEPVTLQRLTQALASFERSLISASSPYDRYVYGGNKQALSLAAQRGEKLFFSEKTECFHCHGGFNFSDASQHAGSTFTEQPFHNTGLYNLDGTGAYPANNTGLYELSHRPEDMGRFRAPSLRNIALTAPYMHDGSMASLAEVIDHYAAGGRRIAAGPQAGDGSRNPYKSGFVKGFSLSAEEKADLIAFLESLSDQNLVRNPAYADPFGQQP